MVADVPMVVGKSEKQSPVNEEMFNTKSSSGWQILNFLKEVKTSVVIFVKKRNRTNSVSLLLESISFSMLVDICWYGYYKVSLVSTNSSLICL